jgi:hypothetical protein
MIDLLIEFQTGCSSDDRSRGILIQLENESGVEGRLPSADTLGTSAGNNFHGAEKLTLALIRGKIASSDRSMMIELDMERCGATY